MRNDFGNRPYKSRFPYKAGTKKAGSKKQGYIDKKDESIGERLGKGKATKKDPKKAKSKAVEASDDAGIHVRHNALKDYGPYSHKVFDPTTVRPDKVFGNVHRDDYGVGFKKGGSPSKRGVGIAKRGFGRALGK